MEFRRIFTAVSKKPMPSLFQVNRERVVLSENALRDKHTAEGGFGGLQDILHNCMGIRQ